MPRDRRLEWTRSEEILLFLCSLEGLRAFFQVVEALRLPSGDFRSNFLRQARRANGIPRLSIHAVWRLPRIEFSRDLSRCALTHQNLIVFHRTSDSRFRHPISNFVYPFNRLRNRMSFFVQSSYYVRPKTIPIAAITKNRRRHYSRNGS